LIRHLSKRGNDQDRSDDGNRVFDKRCGPVSLEARRKARAQIRAA
jgi:hypothetical protein